MNPRILLLPAALLLAACAAREPRATDEPATATVAAAAATGLQPLPAVLGLPGYPLSTSARPTTPGHIYRGNLEARIGVLEARPDAGSPTVQAHLAGALFEHYQAYGALERLDRAAELASRAAAAGPDNADAQLIHAHISAYLHRFDEARPALELARKLRAKPQHVARLEQQIAEALGQPKTRAAALPQQLEGAADAIELAQRCVLEGDLDCASRNFHQAQFLDNDTGPVALAWLHTQQGITLLRFGHPQAAIPFFRAALERVPGYYVAAEHLGECLGLTGQHAEAIQVYAAVIEQTGNPEYMAGLAAVLADAGDSAGAAVWRQRAKAGYADLLQRHPATYAQHAVDFYLEIGDPQRALQLAQQNIGLRQDVGSWLLLAQAQSAHADTAAACSAFGQARATGWQPPEMLELRPQYASCD